VASDYQELSIYNISGKLIDSIIINDNSHWDASKYSEGLYFITAIKNGKKSDSKNYC